MTAQASIPLKWYVPFANNDSSRVELPVTTSDPTRASQSLGFPPLTMQPPESGGVPPQGEDFNGGMNQVARICWWLLNGGGYPYDSVFASNSNINGYPNGATLQSADFLGQWISVADNNQNNPDVSGASWVPGFQYGVTSLTGLTGGTVTPTPAQAAKRAITLAGALTSALTIILPTWLKDWTITNGTSGAFVVIVKTVAGSGITIPQTAQPTRVSGDGTNIVQSAENIAAATQPTNAMQFGQATGRLLRTSVYLRIAGVQNVSVNGGAFTTTGAGAFTALANTTSIIAEVVGGGGGSGGTAGTGAGANSIVGGGGGGGYAKGLYTSGFASLTPTVGAGGTGGGGSANGTAGGTTSLGALISATGGSGSTGGTSGSTSTTFLASGAGGGLGSNGTFTNALGTQGGTAISLSASVIGGAGGAAANGGAGPGAGGAGVASAAGLSPGSGASGACIGPSTTFLAGSAGAGGLIIVQEFA